MPAINDGKKKKTLTELNFNNIWQRRRFHIETTLSKRNNLVLKAKLAEMGRGKRAEVCVCGERGGGGQRAKEQKQYCL